MRRHHRWVLWLGLLLSALTLRSAAGWSIEAGNNLLAIVFSILCSVFILAWCIVWTLLFLFDDE